MSCFIIVVTISSTRALCHTKPMSASFHSTPIQTAWSVCCSYSHVPRRNGGTEVLSILSTITGVMSLWNCGCDWIISPVPPVLLRCLLVTFLLFLCFVVLCWWLCRRWECPLMWNKVLGRMHATYCNSVSSSETVQVHWDGAGSGCNSGWLGSLWFPDPWAELNPGLLLTIENLVVSQPGTTAGLIRRECGLRLRAECATGRLGLEPPALNV